MKKVLIVEDDELLRMFYDIEISDMGYDVIIAKDGIEALDKVRKENPDLVILDLALPKMNGLECLRKMLGINSNAVVPNKKDVGFFIVFTPHFYITGAGKFIGIA